jgi:hypothetical protein
VYSFGPHLTRFCIGHQMRAPTHAQVATIAHAVFGALESRLRVGATSFFDAYETLAHLTDTHKHHMLYNASPCVELH